MEEDKHTEERFTVLSTRRNASRSSAHGGTLHGPQHTGERFMVLSTRRNASWSSAHEGTLHGPQHTREHFTVLSTRRNASRSSAHGGTLHGPQHTREHFTRSSAHEGTLHGPQHTEERFTVLSIRRNASRSSLCTLYLGGVGEYLKCSNRSIERLCEREHRERLKYAAHSALEENHNEQRTLPAILPSVGSSARLLISPVRFVI